MSVVYHIAGPADDEDYAQAEHLGEMLMNSLQGVNCIMHTVLPENWSDFVKGKSAFLGCRQRCPLVWLSTGVIVGGLPEFNAEVEKKYGITTKHIEFATWPKIAAENLAAARAAAANTGPVIVGTKGSGAVRGAAVSEALLAGNERHVEGADDAVAPAVLGANAVATVVALTPLPDSAHVLLDCAPEQLFVVPCSPAGLEDLAVGNVEHGVMSRGTRAVLVVAANTPEFGAHVHASRDAPLHRDTPLARSQSAALEGHAPALSRTLALAPLRATPRELERLCLEEWVRHSADQLLRDSAMLAELHARGGFHLERLVCSDDGALAIV